MSGLRAIDLLGHLKANVDSCISADVARWGPGYAALAWDCCIFVTDPDFRNLPIYLYRPYVAAWERMSLACHESQKALVPKRESEQSPQNTNQSTRIIRG